MFHTVHLLLSAPSHPTGTVEALGTIENIMEHIASYLGQDPHDVRMINMVPPGVARLLVPPHERNVVAEDIIPLLLQKAMFTQRKEEVSLFNRVSVCFF